MQETATARELLHELQRAHWLPPYKASSVRTVVETMSEMYRDSRELQRLDGVDMRDPRDSADMGGS